MSKIFTQFLKEPGVVGAFCASSPALAREITSGIGLEAAKTVVELGPGTGAFTKLIVDKISPEAEFVAVELSEEIYHYFKKKFPGVRVYNKSASELGGILNAEELEHAELVISGLPWATFPAELQDELLNAIHENLAPGGVFTTFAYLQGMILPSARRFKRRLKKYFAHVERRPVVWANLPPAFVYRCRN